MRKRFTILVLAAIAAWAGEIPAGQLKLFAPLPEAPKADAALVELGRRLYFEGRLSKDGKVSCNTCHPLDKAGADGQATSAGVGGKRGARNSPTVLNAALHVAQFWDGRAADVEAQAQGPVLNPVEMAMADARAVQAALRAAPEYGPLFAKAFPKDREPVTLENAARAIGAFERQLLTPSRWDRFLKGDSKALNEAEKAGFQQFLAAGCAFCHRGALLGGTSYQKLGMSKPYAASKDEGRAAVTKQAADRGFFKVPSLRNVARTGPYLHDGSVASLEEAIRLMAEYQIGTKLTAAEAHSIRVWLEALNGEPPAELLRAPGAGKK